MMKTWKSCFRVSLISRAALVAALAFGGGGVFASGLQVSPISLSLAAGQGGEGIWLSNTGAQSLHAQVRLYRWTQEQGKDVLTPSNDLAISPPILSVEPGAQQLVRTLRLGAPLAGSNEQAYRLLIDELPVTTSGHTGLQFVLHYSVPVFVEPSAVNVATTKPQLTWSFKSEGSRVMLEVSNTGSVHAQLAQLTFVDQSHKKHELTAGLLGYVLPGATMRWAMKEPTATFAGGGTIEGLVNSEEVTQNLSLVTSSP
jgi:fimbrial chaperone protein